MLPARWPLPQADGGVDDRAEHRYPEDRHEGHPEPAPAAHPVIHHSSFRLYEDAPGAASAHPARPTYLAGVTTDRSVDELDLTRLDHAEGRRRIPTPASVGGSRFAS